MGLRVLATRLYSLVFFKVKHRQRQVDKKSSHEWKKWGAQKASEDFFLKG